MAEPTPITILTGFLGAGKTTLLNHLLKQPELANTAVLVNEFGDIALDHLLVEKLDETTALLPSGCLCCAVRGNLAQALKNLLPRIEAGAVARVVIETTGLADPAPILATLMTDLTAATRFRLDGVVTVIDAVHALTQLEAHPEALRQAAIADRLVLAKADIAPNTAALRARLATLNPGAPILTADHGRIDPAAILHAGLFNPASKAPEIQSWLNAAAYNAPAVHTQGITAFCLSYDTPLPWQGIGGWLEMLIATRGDSILRLKAILNLAGQSRPVVLHGVQHLLHPPTLLPAWPDDDPRTSRLVFITQNLPRDVIEEGLAAFLQAADALSEAGA